VYRHDVTAGMASSSGVCVSNKKQCSDQPDKAIINNANRMYEIQMTKCECMAVSMYRMMIEWLLAGVNNL